MIDKHYKTHNSAVPNHMLSHLTNNDLDKTDIQIIDLMILGKNNREISLALKIPLSTIQRRARKIITNKIVFPEICLNHEKFGIKKGLLHVYTRDGDIRGLAKRISEIDGVTSTEIHLGNSDINVNILYKNGQELLDTISTIKKLDKIEKLVWSELLYYIPSKRKINLSKLISESKGM